MNECVEGEEVAKGRKEKNAQCVGSWGREGVVKEGGDEVEEDSKWDVGPLGINSRLKKNVISALRRSACLSSRSLFETLGALFLYSFSLQMKGFGPDCN